ncbi:MAG: ABC-ATPase domain-containing protein, partial [Lentisphaerae bacterium]|nr:ABC-ATPase domain-containing protein [Lentisphaerota bacterium]
VQGDPFAAPSRVRVRVRQDRARFPSDTHAPRSREIALRDFLTRRFHAAARRLSSRGQGSGKSGLIDIDRPGQEILERTSVFVTDSFVEARFVVGLPAFGRRVAGRHAADMLCRDVPAIVEDSLLFTSLDCDSVYRHVETAEDADALRDQLADHDLVAFVADGAILPRATGIDDRPLSEGDVVPFKSPASLCVTLATPNRGGVTGMGIPRGVTLIVGGGYHGKSTLLAALEQGIYNHVPGDGREQVVTDPNAVKIRAEDGRGIEKVCITPFISDLPFGKDTDAFSTDDASGSTSQAANIVEALEIGASALLIDEDTSATNFMIRDHRMQELVAADREPITPFIDKVRQLASEKSVSTVLVIGGSGDYFDVADRVLCMLCYEPKDVTAEACEIAERHKAERKPEGGESFGAVRDRTPLAAGFDARKGRREAKISEKGLNAIAFGVHHIDLSAVEQLADTSQTRAIGDAIHYAVRYMDGTRTLREVVERVMADIEEEGLDILSDRPAGDYARFRGQELAAAINRLRTLQVRQEMGLSKPPGAC